MSNYVVPIRKGGLGNQLFQVAAGIVYQEEKGKTVLLPNEIMNTHNTSQQEYADTVFCCISNRIDIAFHEDVLAHFLQHGFTKHSISPGFDAWSPEDISGNVILHGYFHYYPPIGRHESIVREMYLQGLKPLIKNYTPQDSWVGIHIRRGDYLQYPYCDFLISQPLSYYEKALEYFQDATITFLIFSDDIPWCKEQALFKELSQKIFVEEDDECKTLAIMTQCQRGFICASSTFSWWGAYLGAYAERQPVIAPLRWFRNEYVNLFPPGWVLLSGE